jgi:hypothetical protein
MDHRDFDMMVMSWGQSLSPGNEQRDFWSSAAADEPGSRNIIGIKNPAIDAIIDDLIASPTREALVARTRALDRALLWGHYVIPQWHLTADRVASWTKLSRPQVTPTRGVQFDAWWIDPQKERTVAQKLPEVQAEAEASPPPDSGTAAAPTDAKPASAEPPADKPSPFAEWWRWAMVAAVLALAILRFQRRKR